MHPIIPYFEPFKIPLPFTIPIVNADAIHMFGILVATGFIVGSRVAQNKARRDGIEAQIVNDFVGWIVVAVFVGGHVGHLLMYEPAELMQDPMALLRMTSGLSSFGGFVASIIFALYYFRKVRREAIQENKRRHGAGEPLKPMVTAWAYADALIYGFMPGWFFGRMGCFSAHDHSGTPTNFWLGVPGMNPSLGCTRDVACHDLGLYEALWSLAMCGVFALLDRKPRFPGFYCAAFLLSYGPTRLLMDAFRHPDGDTRYLGVTPAQIGSILMIAGGIWIWWRRKGEGALRAPSV
jgi:phosphatidylglycerol:prolipoprotein diacylglycerol transferase